RHEQRTAERLVIFLGYNRLATDTSRFLDLQARVEATLRDPTLSSKNVKIVLTEFTWTGIRYPFGLMRTHVLNMVKSEFQTIQAGRCQIGLIAMDGDVEMTPGAWAQAHLALRDSSKGFFGATGFWAANKPETSLSIPLTQQALELDYAVQQGLKTKSRPNETFTYLTGECARLMLTEPSPYPIFDNENNHLSVWLHSLKYRGFPIKRHLNPPLSAKNDRRVRLMNDSSFQVSSKQDRSVPNTWVRKDALSYFSILRSQRQNMAHPRAIGQWLGVVYRVDGTSVSKLAKVFDWKRIIKTTPLHPCMVKEFQDMLYLCLSQRDETAQLREIESTGRTSNPIALIRFLAPMNTFLRHYADELLSQIPLLTYEKLLRKLYRVSLAVSDFMETQVGASFERESSHQWTPSTFQDFFVDLGWEPVPVNPVPPTLRLWTPHFDGRRGQINEPYRRYSPDFPTPHVPELSSPISKRALDPSPDTGIFHIQIPPATPAKKRRVTPRSTGETPMDIGLEPSFPHSSPPHTLSSNAVQVLKTLSDRVEADITQATRAHDSKHKQPGEDPFKIRLQPDATAASNLDTCVAALSACIKKNKHEKEWFDLLDHRNLRINDRPFNTMKDKLTTLIQIGLEQGMITPDDPFGIEKISEIVLELIRYTHRAEIRQYKPNSPTPEENPLA
ncbi:hypothetical protein EBR96_07590, partial [bacterium]|nr:hypothetical protein [bacterium]